jgi:bacillithiol biosynthesis cysteine-adding enzyme BshC
MAQVREAYRPERNLAQAFAGLLAAWLGPHGLVVLDPTHRSVKERMVPLLLQSLERAGDLDAALTERAKALSQAGSPTPVHVGDGATLVMVEGDLGRDRLVIAGTDFTMRRSGERLCLDDIRALASSQPERLSPNVLLRPVIEAAILPTVAYIGGPGELAYFPQCDPVYESLGVTPQARLGRWGARLVEPKVTKVLEKFSIRAQDLALPEGQLEARLVRDAIPTEATTAINALRQALATEYDRLREAAVAVDPTLRKPVESQRGQALAGVADVEKRIVHHLKQQNDILVQQVAKARANLMPLGKPQERVFGPVPFLIRYGTAFIDLVLTETEAWVATWPG